MICLAKVEESHGEFSGLSDGTPNWNHGKPHLESEGVEGGVNPPFELVILTPPRSRYHFENYGKARGGRGGGGV